MMFSEMYAEAKRAGLTETKMRENCEAQRQQYLRFAAEADARERGNPFYRNGDHWRESAERCTAMLAWLDRMESAA